MVADDVQEALEALAAAVGRGVSIDDPDGRVIAHSAHNGETDPVRARAILSRSVPPEVGAWQRAHGAGVATGPVRVPPNPDLAMEARLCVALLHRGRRLGFLWVIEGERPLTPAETGRVVRDAARVAALLGEGFPGRSARSRPPLCRLLTGGAGDRREAAARLAACGLPEHVPYHVLVVRPPAAAPGVRRAAGPPGGLPPGDAEPGGDGMVTSTSRLSELIGGEVRGLRPPAAHAVIDGRTVVLAPHGRAPYPGGITVVAGGFPPGSAVGASAAHSALEAAPEAYRQALAASRAAAADPGAGPLVVWPELGVYRFFGPPAGRGRPDGEAASGEAGSGEVAGGGVTGGKVCDVGVLSAEAGDPLMPLRRRDPRGVLVATLEAYLDSGGDAQATAEAAHLHRTSLYYRLRRIEEITGRDLRNGRDRLELHLALKLARWDATA
ncbi:PucR family transcriptional regulator [Sphaerisporangium perillae]|uniref:PucR family transcriptional regulator n=1 Tax=Sphaerisporangium perillae TaxID=2935860 RepID=UPI00200F1027|nr:helix-turn-helix domain-containing protein [Sphaerisporangium perillae]